MSHPARLNVVGRDHRRRDNTVRLRVTRNSWIRYNRKNETRFRQIRRSRIAYATARVSIKRIREAPIKLLPGRVAAFNYDGN